MNPSINPSLRRALVVIDVQEEYVTGGLLIEYPPIQESLANIGRAMDAARAAAIPIVVVQHTAPPSAPVFVKGTPAWELHEVVSSRPRDHYVEKAFPSAFAGTDLAAWLKARGVDTITVVGYMTQNCDDSTLKQAESAGLKAEFLQDASGAVPYENRAGFASAEEIHRVYSVVLQSRFASVMSTEAWIEAVSHNTPAPAVETIFDSNQRARRRQGVPA
ncbi:cysteine hydrolase [Geothrix limicola]|uniref:Cysteine hydrolase n=1 Tax=Geothrix limicola TaxID=2927978 RepID=A0ABQ5QFJ5_9BACT|nr:cysteine hydrolase family protein [Geothrix limicola]GLH73463.1 cysteine hydrolase [Geothrix limicola]